MKIDHAETTAPAPAAATPGMTVPRSGYLLPRLTQLVVGLTFFGLSISLVVHAGLGVSPRSTRCG